MAIHEADTGVRMSRLLRAPPAKVFQALIRPELLQRWMCPEGGTVDLVEADPRPGRRFHIAMRAPDGKAYVANGSYTEVRPPKLVAFTWTWEEGHELAGVETNVRIELSARGEHTFLLMTHFGLPTEHERTSHQAGWTGALTNLERLFEPGRAP
jgi:glutathione S-transferase